MARRRFTKEYKQEAVSLVQQSDIPVAKIARNLDTHVQQFQQLILIRKADPAN